MGVFLWDTCRCACCRVECWPLECCYYFWAQWLGFTSGHTLRGACCSAKCWLLEFFPCTWCYSRGCSHRYIDVDGRENLNIQESAAALLGRIPPSIDQDIIRVCVSTIHRSCRLYVASDQDTIRVCASAKRCFYLSAWCKWSGHNQSLWFFIWFCQDARILDKVIHQDARELDIFVLHRFLLVCGAGCSFPSQKLHCSKLLSCRDFPLKEIFVQKISSHLPTKRWTQLHRLQRGF